MYRWQPPPRTSRITWEPSTPSGSDGRRRRACSRRVTALKAFQQRRFSHTYADLLASPRYGAAARYFLDELYGPKDFSARDAQFARVAPKIARVFPSEVAETLAILSELHALSETLDTAMSLQLASDRIAPRDYIAAWQGVGRPSDRNRQIDLTLSIARSSIASPACRCCAMRCA